ncbi:hypothetical protein D3C87_280330 [compost metagenome]
MAEAVKKHHPTSVGEARSNMLALVEKMRKSAETAHSEFHNGQRLKNASINADNRAKLRLKLTALYTILTTFAVTFVSDLYDNELKALEQRLAKLNEAELIEA